MSDDPNEFHVVDIRELDVVSGDQFKAWLGNKIGASFADGLKFWTSSRGDHWEQIEAKSAEEAAMKQAERWSELGYRGPFSIMVSVSGIPEPPTAGERVWIFQLVPEVVFRGHKLEFKILP